MALDPKLVGRKSDPLTFSYTTKEAILYALSVGGKEDELDYLVELRGPKVLPTFAVVPSFHALVATVGNIGVSNPLKVLHGEQKIVLHRPIPSSGTITTVAEIKGVYDKGKGALVVVEAKTVDEKKEPLFDNVFSIFALGEGGFGGDRGPEAQTPEPPAGKAADFKVTEATTKEQALLYRLNGDVNPLHAEPAAAAMIGFPRPILHGLCTYGFAGRAILKSLCKGDAKRFKSFGARFAKPVLPGDTLTTEGWQVSGGTYAIRTTTQDGTPVLTQGVAEVTPA